MNSYAIDTHTAIKKLEAVGFQTEQAEVVTSLFSSRESELVTKEDLKTAISGLRVELKADNAVLQEQIKSIRSDLQEQIKSIRSDLQEQINSTRSDLQEQIKSTRSDLQEQIKSTRIEIRFILAFVVAMLVPLFLRSFGLI